MADPTTGIPGPTLTFIDQVTTTFEGLVGWPQNVDWAQAEADLYAAGPLVYGTPTAAVEWLYNSSYLTDQQRQSMPWAEVGLDHDTYTQRVELMSSAWNDLTGSKITPDVLKRAISEQWTPTQMTYFLQYGSPSGAAPGQPMKDLSTMPWLTDGETYKSVQSQYVATTGQLPNVKAVASWWKFNRSAQQVTNAQTATMTLGPSQKGADTEIR